MSRSPHSGTLARFATWVSAASGSTSAFTLAFGIVVAWLVTGPMFHYSNTWQLVINTGTTIITFLMVFLIQRAQNRESLAVQLKLNELVAAMIGASNRLISVEDLSEEELKVLHAHYLKLADMSKLERDITESHSIDEAESRHYRKHQGRGTRHDVKKTSDKENGDAATG